MKQIYITLAVYVLTSIAWLVICWFVWNKKEQPVMNNTKEIQRIDSILNSNAGALKEYKLQQQEIQFTRRTSKRPSIIATPVATSKTSR